MVKHIRALSAAESATFHSGDEIHVFPHPIGSQRIRERLAEIPWFSEHLNRYFPRRNASLYVDAVHALGRIVTLSVLLRTWNVDDIVIASGLPRLLVAVAVWIMLDAGYMEAVDGYIALEPPISSQALGDLVDRFLHDCIEGKMKFLDLLTALGIEIRDSEDK